MIQPISASQELLAILDYCKPLAWLMTTPSSDINFKSALKTASDADLAAAIQFRQKLPYSKTATRCIEAEQRRRARQNTTTNNEEQD